MADGLRHSDVYDISDRFVERFAALDPVAATLEGIAGYDDRMTDYSPDATGSSTLAARCTRSTGRRSATSSIASRST